MFENNYHHCSYNDPALGSATFYMQISIGAERINRFPGNDFK
jgi:hypothetical protein